MPVTAPRISVVIPVHNGAETILGCLQSIERQSRVPDELVVVDNNSTDNTADIVLDYLKEHSFTQVQLVHETRQGASAARHKGVEATTGDLVCFTDADCEPTPAWIEQLVGAFGENPAIGAVAGNIVGKTPQNVLQLFLRMFTLRGASQGGEFHTITPLGGGFPTANFAVRRALYLSVGGFDARIKIYGEDYDLCARIYRAGYRIRYTEKALVHHVHRSTVAGMLRQSFGFGRAHALGLRSYYQPRLTLEIPGRSFAWKVGKLAAWIDLASADKKLVALLLAAWWYKVLLLLVGAYLVYLERRIRQRMRRLALQGGFLTSLQCVALLVLKSAAMTAGRWYGSFRHRVVCL